MEVKLCMRCEVPKTLLYFLSMMLFAMLSFKFVHRFLCLFLNVFLFNSLLNNVKAETVEIYYNLSV